MIPQAPLAGDLGGPVRKALAMEGASRDVGCVGAKAPPPYTATSCDVLLIVRPFYHEFYAHLPLAC